MRDAPLTSVVEQPNFLNWRRNRAPLLRRRRPQPCSTLTQPYEKCSPRSSWPLCVQPRTMRNSFFELSSRRCALVESMRCDWIAVWRRCTRYAIWKVGASVHVGSAWNSPPSSVFCYLLTCDSHFSLGVSVFPLTFTASLSSVYNGRAGGCFATNWSFSWWLVARPTHFSRCFSAIRLRVQLSTTCDRHSRGNIRSAIPRAASHMIGRISRTEAALGWTWTGHLSLCFIAVIVVVPLFAGLPRPTDTEIFAMSAALGAYKLILTEPSRRDTNMLIRLNCSQSDVLFALKTTSGWSYQDFSSLLWSNFLRRLCVLLSVLSMYSTQEYRQINLHLSTRCLVFSVISFLARTSNASKTTFSLIGRDCLRWKNGNIQLFTWGRLSRNRILWRLFSVLGALALTADWWRESNPGERPAPDFREIE